MSYYMQQMGYGRKTGPHTVKLVAGKLTTEANEAIKSIAPQRRGRVRENAKRIAASQNRAYVTVAMLAQADRETP